MEDTAGNDFPGIALCCNQQTTFGYCPRHSEPVRTVLQFVIPNPVPPAPGGNGDTPVIPNPARPAGWR